MGSVDKVVLCSVVHSLAVALVPDSGLASYIWFQLILGALQVEGSRSLGQKSQGCVFR